MLYATVPGFTNKSKSWVPPHFVPSLEIVVQEPSRNGTYYPNYTLYVGGGASIFNPSCVCVGDFVTSRGITLEDGALPHLSI